jgi:hypothetical protein
MSEELEQNNDGTLSGLKKTIIGVATTAIMGLGTWGVTQITGGGDEPAPAQQAAPVINITNSNQQSQQAAGGGTTKIIERERVVEKPASAAPAPKPKKKEGDEFKEEEPKW